MTSPPGAERTVSWRELLAETEHLLGTAGVESPAQEARWIVEEASGLGGAGWVLGLDEPATVRGVTALDAMVTRRRAGEPIQYVLGHWPFRSLDLMVDPRVLIPRPETEVVAEHALAALDSLGRVPPGDPPRRVVDLGTGTGALALAVATERPGTEVWAVERSAGAAAVARANVAGQGRRGRHVRVVEGSWYDPLPADLRGAVDVVVSNPPYVATTEELPPSVADWEPAEALLAGERGLDDLEVIVAGAGVWLHPGGWLVVEVGESQGDDVSRLAADAGFADVGVHPDLARRPRVLVARLP